MKNVFFVICAGLLFSACSKDKFETIPQIEFKDLKQNVVTENLLSNQKYLAPILTFKVTDAEGDFGSNSNSDSSFIVIKHLLTNVTDSIRFPDLTSAPKNDFSAEVDVNLFDFIQCYNGPAGPRVDTIYYDFYVRDAKNHKSNIVRTTIPVLRTCQ